MTNHNSPPSVGKRVGEFLILGLYLAVDVVEVWDKSHLWTLVLAFLGVFALLLLDGGFSRRQIFASTAIAAMACITIYFVAPEFPEAEAEIVGTLQPGNDPTPPNACGSLPSEFNPAETLRILIGTNAYVSGPGMSKSRQLKSEENQIVAEF